MVKKNKSFTEEALDLAGGLTVGGTGLSVGAGVVDKLPASAAKTGVLSGLGTAGSFMPTMAAVGAAGLTMKQLRNLRGSQGACGGTRRLDGSGRGVGNIGTSRQPIRKEKKDNGGFRI